MVYVPGLAYVYVGLVADELPPSPKDQLLAFVPVEVLARNTVLPETDQVKLAEQEEFPVESTTVTCWQRVSTQNPPIESW